MEEINVRIFVILYCNLLVYIGILLVYVDCSFLLYWIFMVH